MKQLLKGQPHVIGPGGLEFEILQRCQSLLLFRGQIVLIFKPNIACFGKERFGFGLISANLIHSLINQFHDMKTIKSNICIGKIIRDPGNERWRHVAADFFYLLWLSFMGGQLLSESLDGFLVPTRGCKKELSVFHIEKEADIIMPAFACGFIHPNEFHF